MGLHLHDISWDLSGINQHYGHDSGSFLRHGSIRLSREASVGEKIQIFMMFHGDRINNSSLTSWLGSKSTSKSTEFPGKIYRKPLILWIIGISWGYVMGMISGLSLRTGNCLKSMAIVLRITMINRGMECSALFSVKPIYKIHMSIRMMLLWHLLYCHPAYIKYRLINEGPQHE